ncbi:hypothetical protein ACLB2K_073737 [Fragaria x ananassa]
MLYEIVFMLVLFLSASKSFGSYYGSICGRLVWDDDAKPASEAIPSILGWFAEYQVTHANLTVPVRVPMIKWEKRMVGVIKLNVDAAFDSPTSQVGLGGVFKDANGSFQWGFGHSLSCVASAKHAELLALIIRMACALSHDLVPVVVETNCLELVQGVTGQYLEFLSSVS